MLQYSELSIVELQRHIDHYFLIYFNDNVVNVIIPSYNNPNISQNNWLNVHVVLQVYNRVDHSGVGLQLLALRAKNCQSAEHQITMIKKKEKRLWSDGRMVARSSRHQVTVTTHLWVAMTMTCHNQPRTQMFFPATLQTPGSCSDTHTGIPSINTHTPSNTHIHVECTVW